MTVRAAVRAVAAHVLALATAASAAALAGCGAPEGEAPAVDSAFVETLAELHLADARAALDTTEGDGAATAGGDSATIAGGDSATIAGGAATRPDPALAESLRAEVLAARNLDAAALEKRMDRLARDPDLARATYDALDARLSLERQGVTRDP